MVYSNLFAFVIFPSEINLVTKAPSNYSHFQKKSLLPINDSKSSARCLKMVVLYFNRNNFCKTKIHFCNTGISLKIPVISELHYVQDGEFQKDSLKRQFSVSKDYLARNYLARNVSTEVQPLGGHLVISS